MNSTKVLLVDDEAQFLATLSKPLSKRGLAVSTAETGPDALEKLDQDSAIDVVILDVKMPGMDGIETLRRIKISHPLVEVIMLTGHATVYSAIEGMKLGAMEYLMKPCEMDVLMARVKEAKEKKTMHEEKIAEARAIHLALRRGD